VKSFHNETQTNFSFEFVLNISSHWTMPIKGHTGLVYWTFSQGQIKSKNKTLLLYAWKIGRKLNLPNCQPLTWFTKSFDSDTNCISCYKFIQKVIGVVHNKRHCSSWLGIAVLDLKSIHIFSFFVVLRSKGRGTWLGIWRLWVQTPPRTSGNGWPRITKKFQL